MLTSKPVRYSIDSPWVHPKLHVRKHITLKDGTVLSVQASEYHFCTPRDNVGPYTHYEVMVMAGKVPYYWAKYSADKDTNVFANIPAWWVGKLIAERGYTKSELNRLPYSYLPKIPVTLRDRWQAIRVLLGYFLER